MKFLDKMIFFSHHSHYLSNNFQGVNFTMSKDEQTPKKEPKDRLSSYPSCCWYPSLLERLKDVVQLLQFGQFLKQVKDVQLFQYLAAATWCESSPTFMRSKSRYQKFAHIKPELQVGHRAKILYKIE